jgi:hypothetical protein
MIICTFYSHRLGLDTLKELVASHFPSSEITLSGENTQSLLIEIKTLDSGSNTCSIVSINYRERMLPDYQFPQENDSSLTANLKGLYGYVNSLPLKNSKLKEAFLKKVESLNCEFSIQQEPDVNQETIHFIKELAKQLEAVLFVQPNTAISKSSSQHFLDQDLNLITDGEGNSEIDNLKVNIETKYFDKKSSEISQDQQDRRRKSEAFLQANNIKINHHLPFIELESETTLRRVRKVAERVTLLALTNSVAFNTISGDEALEYLAQYNLVSQATPQEIDFLKEPSEDKKNRETWKCEGIWVLMWALNLVNDLGSPNEMADLNKIPYEKYPIGKDKDPNTFISTPFTLKSKAEILDAADLYYRIDWACVEARINQQEIENVHPGVVFERHYALNWLINYMDEEWDDVSCDT